MELEVAWTAGAIAVVSAALTAVVRKLALAHGRLDIPNARSSHSVPTPRGGGAAIVLAASVGFAALALSRHVDTAPLIALLGGGLAVAAVGYLDDHFQLSPLLRLSVHLGAAIWAVAWLGGLPPLRIGAHLHVFGWPGYALAVLGLVWTLNLFNFMDGIDGIAASQATFMVWGAALVTALAGMPGNAALELIFGAACAGFLLWNWPPAKIFMGDVGSGYLGYVIGVAAIADGRAAPAALWVWLILGGIFLVDATVTLARRLLRRERVYQAHRSHAYQWLARRWGSHRRVTVLMCAVNVLWLAPCALLAAKRPQEAAWISLAALAPLLVLALFAGAGRSEGGGRL